MINIGYKDILHTDNRKIQLIRSNWFSFPICIDIDNNSIRIDYYRYIIISFLWWHLQIYFDKTNRTNFKGEIND